MKFFFQKIFCIHFLFLHQVQLLAQLKDGNLDDAFFQLKMICQAIL